MATNSPPASTISRRIFMRNVGSAALLASAGATVLGSCANGSDDGSSKLVYAGFGGSYEKAIMDAVFTPFAKKHGIKVQATTGAGNVAKTKSMVDAGQVEWDLVDTQGATLGQMSGLDLLEKLDGKVTKGVEPLVNEELRTPYSIPWYQFSHNIFWNAKAFDGRMTSWADVWDVKKFPGTRGFLTVPWFTLEIALAADGVPIDQLYPLDLDRAFASLDRIRPHAVFQDVSALANSVTAQDVVTGDLNLLRVKDIADSGVQLEYTWEQAILEVQQLVVLRGSPNADAAMRAVEYAMRPEPQRRVLELLGYSPTVKSVIDDLDEKQAADLAGTPQTLDNSFYLNAGWWAKHGAEASERYEEWLVS